MEKGTREKAKAKIESKTDDVPALLSEPTMNHKALIA